MSTEKEKNYYVKNKRILMRQFDYPTPIVKELLREQIDENKFTETVKRREMSFNHFCHKFRILE